jgi:hypothetical protein
MTANGDVFIQISGYGLYRLMSEVILLTSVLSGLLGAAVQVNIASTTIRIFDEPD